MMKKMDGFLNTLASLSVLKSRQFNWIDWLIEINASDDYSSRLKGDLFLFKSHEQIYIACVCI